MDTSYAVFCGIDVGKSEHHAVGLAVDGTRLCDKVLPNDEARLRAVFDRLAEHGPLLIVVDQPNTIGALPVTVARACGHRVAYLPGLSMRRIADLYPGKPRPMRGRAVRAPSPPAAKPPTRRCPTVPGTTAHRTPRFTIDRLTKGFYLDAGKVTPNCFNQRVFGSEFSKVLEYNTSVTHNGYTCTSRADSMICDADDGHGFVLPKQQATWN